MIFCVLNMLLSQNICSSFESENLVIMQVLTASSFGLKPITYQCTVHCTDIPCITFFVTKPRKLFHLYFAFAFLLEFTKTSSMVEKSLNGGSKYQTLNDVVYPQFKEKSLNGDSKYQTLNDVVYPQFKSRNKHSSNLSLKGRRFPLGCI